MGKAILVIDMPESCNKCDIEKESELSGCYCGVTGEDTPYNSRPKWCPLKPVPEMTESEV